MVKFMIATQKNPATGKTGKHCGETPFCIQGKAHNPQNAAGEEVISWVGKGSYQVWAGNKEVFFFLVGNLHWGLAEARGCLASVARVSSHSGEEWLTAYTPEKLRNLPCGPS